MYPKKRQNSYSRNQFYTKKPVKSFRDLEIYSEAQKIAAQIIKSVVPILKRENENVFPWRVRFSKGALLIPLRIAEGYGIRFNDLQSGVEMLDRAALGCNRMIVYLEQVRELYCNEEEKKLCEELTKRYFLIRIRIQNLVRNWVKWHREDSARSGKENENDNGPTFRKDFRRSA